jgi:hypothetical protein
MIPITILDLLYFIIGAFSLVIVGLIIFTIDYKIKECLKLKNQQEQNYIYVNVDSYMT